jgi:hypothetical protein
LTGSLTDENPYFLDFLFGEVEDEPENIKRDRVLRV